ncbi:hypothetical protein FA13DRAFT_1737671 [Coprinellus micaceus]|jgi:hypothetical protein|uniref:Uncharacterized protein n=1 Tax=Coprinellus micaceus TaxID=71717 RepID=A0A4Y7SWQ1_COPMI|nr:hypothetical protein FA13DRAFT_1737671 [Coprinellus micaceus]
MEAETPFRVYAPGLGDPALLTAYYSPSIPNLRRLGWLELANGETFLVVPSVSRIW